MNTIKHTVTRSLTPHSFLEGKMGLWVIFCAFFFISCNEWLDVSPKTQIKADDNFSNEQGYEDALTGVYLLLAKESLYGKELTFGMLDAMAQYYTALAQSNTYNYDAAFDYKNANVEARISSVWSNMYTAIANANELIKQIDAADVNSFTGRNYHLIRGEIYGLRAFMHFDLMRLWGESYAANPQHKCIPYMKTVTADVTPLSTVSEVLDLCLQDLAVAETELKVDPVIAGNTMENADETYERDRTFKFNYYAVKLLQARIHLYKGDYAQALAAAKEVTGQQTFYWTPEAEITTSNTATRNRVFSEELVFCLYDTQLRSRYSSYFTSSLTGLLMSESSYQAVYELYKAGYSGDYRYAYQSTELDGQHYSAKLQQPTSGNSNYLFRIPLMRISEAYYIAAECELEENGDIDACVGYLNTVRRNRNLTDNLQGSGLSVSDARDEIRKEYVKEFMCEGQLYYYYKRKNFSAIPINTAVGDAVSTSLVKPDYVFPLPDNEVEYGGRNYE
ncbi:MAG: RagB/SusD family nutrient uptake outer membrane protein [Bacteroidaceae bacterium]|nr:RagB/SusD family nutrient uptake outer membrane protein [Bacteroidaceae bacterium]